MLPISLRRVANISPQQLVLFICFSLGAWSLPSSLSLTRSLKWGLLIGLGVTALYLACRTSRITDKRMVLPLGMMLGAMLLSTAVNHASIVDRIFGWPGELIGLGSWLSFIVIAFALHRHVAGFLATRAALTAVGVVMVVSYLVNWQVIFTGDRFTGALQQATSMGMFAALAAMISWWHFRYKTYPGQPWLSLGIGLLSVAGVVLSQSRIAQLVLLLLLVATLALAARKRRYRLVLLSVLATLMIGTFATYCFTRFDYTDLKQSISYRADIYSAAAQDIQQHHRYLTGIGAGAVPVGLNDRNDVSPALGKSLDEGIIFLSAHNIFLDVALYFGVVSALALLWLNYLSLKYLIQRRHNKEARLMGSVFVVLLLNGLCNVPSMELTLLYLLLLVSLAAPRRKLD